MNGPEDLIDIDEERYSELPSIGPAEEPDRVVKRRARRRRLRDQQASASG